MPSVNHLCSSCVAVQFHEFPSPQERLLIRLSWAKLNREMPDFKMNVLSIPVPKIGVSNGCIALSLASGMMTADSHLKHAARGHLNTICSFIDLVVVDMKLDQSKTSEACKCFAIGALVDRRLTMSTIGLLLSLLISHLQAVMPMKLLFSEFTPDRSTEGATTDDNVTTSDAACGSPAKLLSPSKETAVQAATVASAVQDRKLCHVANKYRNATDNSALVLGWRKLMRYILASMSEGIEETSKAVCSSEQDELLLKRSADIFENCQNAEAAKAADYSGASCIFK